MNPTYNFYQTAAGILQVTMQNGILQEVQFVEAAPAKVAALPQTMPKFVMQGTEFQKQVWQAAMAIPAGTTMTYQELAQKIGKPQAARAVGRALAENKLAYFIPCHRIIQKSGKLGGYAWGIARKRALLQAEKVFLV